MNDHPSGEEVVALYRGGLSPERAEEVSRHLLSPCASCLEEAAPAMGLSLAPEPPGREPLAEKAEKRISFDAAINRALRKVLRYERYVRQQRAQALEALRVLETGGMEALDKLPRGLGHFARMEAFLARSWQLRHDDPQLMVHFAVLAAEVSRRLRARELDSPARVTDFQARAQAELGNAYRAADRLHEAADALGRARRLFERGSRDELLEVRLLELEASLAADRREFGRASASLVKVADFHSRHNDAHRVGRTLVKLGLYAGYKGDLQRAIELLEKSLDLIDSKREPSLACAAAHNLLVFLIDGGRFRDARKLRLAHSRHLVNPGGRINEIKFRALEGRIDAGLGNYPRAEAIFAEVIAGFEEVGLPIIASIERLDLAAALLAQGKAGEAFALVLVASEIFARLEIQREALMAVVLLRDAVEMRTATLEMIEEVARFLRRIEIDPALRFEGRAWEE